MCRNGLCSAFDRFAVLSFPSKMVHAISRMFYFEQFVEPALENGIFYLETDWPASAVSPNGKRRT